jgi:hypothetical protein
VSLAGACTSRTLRRAAAAIGRAWGERQPRGTWPGLHRNEWTALRLAHPRAYARALADGSLGWLDEAARKAHAEACARMNGARA